MAGETIITVVGNLTADPELRFTPSGAAVANFTVASTPRTFDRQSNEWKDGETLFMRCSIWRDAAENVAESLHARRARRGHRPAEVSARTRRRRARSAPSIELDVDEIGPSLRYATAKVNKTSRGGGGGGGGWSGGGGSGGGGGGGGQQGGGGWSRRQLRRSATACGGSPARGGRPVGHRSLAAAAASAAPRRRAPVLTLVADPALSPLIPHRPAGPCDRAHDGQFHQTDGQSDPIPGPAAVPGSRRRSSTMAKPPAAQAEEEAEPAQGGQDHLHRLQGHRAAAQVHLRPGQDPCPSGHRGDRPAAAADRPARSRTPARWRCCPTRATAR